MRGIEIFDAAFSRFRRISLQMQYKNDTMVASKS